MDSAYLSPSELVDGADACSDPDVMVLDVRIWVARSVDRNDVDWEFNAEAFVKSDLSYSVESPTEDSSPDCIFHVLRSSQIVGELFPTYIYEVHQEWDVKLPACPAGEPLVCTSALDTEEQTLKRVAPAMSVYAGPDNFLDVGHQDNLCPEDLNLERRSRDCERVGETVRRIEPFVTHEEPGSPPDLLAESDIDLLDSALETDVLARMSRIVRWPCGHPNADEPVPIELVFTGDLQHFGAGGPGVVALTGCVHGSDAQRHLGVLRRCDADEHEHEQHDDETRELFHFGLPAFFTCQKRHQRDGAN